jgi:hypothetical protein
MSSGIDLSCVGFSGNLNAGIAISLYHLWDWDYLYYHTNIAGA